VLLRSYDAHFRLQQDATPMPDSHAVETLDSKGTDPLRTCAVARIGVGAAMCEAPLSAVGRRVPGMGANLDGAGDSDS
jgi:hypothetical protein